MRQADRNRKQDVGCLRQLVEKETSDLFLWFCYFNAMPVVFILTDH
jgi:hypothetical protein